MKLKKSVIPHFKLFLNLRYLRRTTQRFIRKTFVKLRKEKNQNRKYHFCLKLENESNGIRQIEGLKDVLKWKSDEKEKNGISLLMLGSTTFN